MKVRIQSINFDATETLKQYVDKRMSKLEKNHDEIINVEIYLKVVKPETSSNKEAEIKVSIPSVDFFASKACDSFEEAIDLSVEAVEKQLRKHKEKSVEK